MRASFMIRSPCRHCWRHGSASRALPAHAAPARVCRIALVDVAPDGTPGNGGVGGSDISNDGRYVAFASTSNNLVPNDGNDGPDVFVRDTRTGTTTLVSGGMDGQPANASTEYDAVISGNGRYVAFTSSASDLVPDDTNFERDVFVYDRRTGGDLTGQRLRRRATDPRHQLRPDDLR